jgi:hypothetical protein
VTNSRLNSELLAERAGRTQSAPASQAASAAVSVSTSTNEEILELRERKITAEVNGDFKTAARLEGEIEEKLWRQRQAQNPQIDVRKVIREEVPAVLTEQQDAQRLDEIEADTYEKYPLLNWQAPEANVEAIDFVRAAAAGYVTTGGMSRSGALSTAVSTAVRIYAPSQTPSAAGSQAGSQVISQPVAAPIDEAKLREMAPVTHRSAPVRVDQKAKGGGSFEDGWKSA